MTLVRVFEKERRKKIKTKTRQEVERCVGIMDESHINVSPYERYIRLSQNQ